jgi:hypothetical protein
VYVFYFSVKTKGSLARIWLWDAGGEVGGQSNMTTTASFTILKGRERPIARLCFIVLALDQNGA